MTLMISVDITPTRSEHSTLVPFIIVLTLLIIIIDVRGETEVLKNSNIVWLSVNGSITPVVKTIRSSDTELCGNVMVHLNAISSVLQVRFSCPPGHTDTTADSA